MTTIATLDYYLTAIDALLTTRLNNSISFCRFLTTHLQNLLSCVKRDKPQMSLASTVQKVLLVSDTSDDSILICGLLLNETSELETPFDIECPRIRRWFKFATLRAKLTSGKLGIISHQNCDNDRTFDNLVSSIKESCTLIVNDPVFLARHLELIVALKRQVHEWSNLVIKVFNLIILIPPNHVTDLIGHKLRSLVKEYSATAPQLSDDFKTLRLLIDHFMPSKIGFNLLFSAQIEASEEEIDRGLESMFMLDFSLDSALTDCLLQWNNKLPQWIIKKCTNCSISHVSNSASNVLSRLIVDKVLPRAGTVLCNTLINSMPQTSAPSLLQMQVLTRSYQVIFQDKSNLTDGSFLGTFISFVERALFYKNDQLRIAAYQACTRVLNSYKNKDHLTTRLLTLIDKFSWQCLLSTSAGFRQHVHLEHLPECILNDPDLGLLPLHKTPLPRQEMSLLALRRLFGKKSSKDRLSCTYDSILMHCMRFSTYNNIRILALEIFKEAGYKVTLAMVQELLSDLGLNQDEPSFCSMIKAWRADGLSLALSLAYDQNLFDLDEQIIKPFIEKFKRPCPPILNFGIFFNPCPTMLALHTFLGKKKKEEYDEFKCFSSSELIDTVKLIIDVAKIGTAHVTPEGLDLGSGTRELEDSFVDLSLEIDDFDDNPLNQSQIARSLSWRAVREGAMLLAKIAAKDQSRELGFYLLDLMLSLRHPGAFGGMQPAIEHLSRELFFLNGKQFFDLSEFVEQQLIVLPKVDTTRRSAGLPLCVRSMILYAPEKEQVLESLVSLPEKFFKDHKLINLSTLVHSLNCIRALLRDARLITRLNPLLPRLLYLSLRLMHSSLVGWDVHNAASLMFAQLIQSMFQPVDGKGHALIEFKYPDLLGILTELTSILPWSFALLCTLDKFGNQDLIKVYCETIINNDRNEDDPKVEIIRARAQKMINKEREELDNVIKESVESFVLNDSIVEHWFKGFWSTRPIKHHDLLVKCIQCYDLTLIQIEHIISVTNHEHVLSALMLKYSLINDNSDSRIRKLLSELIEKYSDKDCTDTMRLVSCQTLINLLQNSSKDYLSSSFFRSFIFKFLWDDDDETRECMAEYLYPGMSVEHAIYEMSPKLKDCFKYYDEDMESPSSVPNPAILFDKEPKNMFFDPGWLSKRLLIY